MRTLHVLNDTVAARVQFVPSGMKYIYCMQSYISRHNLTRSRVAGVGQERKKFEGGGEIGGGAGVEGGTGGARGEPQPSQTDPDDVDVSDAWRFACKPQRATLASESRPGPCFRRSPL